jgi:hypothetical protein
MSELLEPSSEADAGDGELDGGSTFVSGAREAATDALFDLVRFAVGRADNDAEFAVARGDPSVCEVAPDQPVEIRTVG